jgi:hypothetical protein
VNFKDIILLVFHQMRKLEIKFTPWIHYFFPYSTVNVVNLYTYDWRNSANLWCYINLLFLFWSSPLFLFDNYYKSHFNYSNFSGPTFTIKVLFLLTRSYNEAEGVQYTLQQKLITTLQNFVHKKKKLEAWLWRS